VVVPFTDEQGSEIVENGKIKATWFVVPGSGTGDLSGLCGEGGFEGHFGKGWITGLLVRMMKLRQWISAG